MMLKEFSKIKKGWLAFGVATTTIGIVTMVDFYCQKHNDLLCMNVVNESPHQVQMASDYALDYYENYVMQPTITVSGTAIISTIL